MKALAVVCPPRISFSSSSSWRQQHLRFRSEPKSQLRSSRFRVSSCLIKEGESESEKQKYKGGVVDELLLNVFRNKMVEEVGWDSDKPGYDGLIEVANRMMLKNPTNSDTKEAAVFVEKCKYLEESKCVGICVNTCKLPTQSFFKDYMGVPLLMEPNFNDYSCQFKFGVLPPLPEDDVALKEPCLAICPNATRRRERNINVEQCPKA
ncbi:hypothetical protein ABKV19_020195 [Rosa sericea]